MRKVIALLLCLWLLASGAVVSAAEISEITAGEMLSESEMIQLLITRLFDAKRREFEDPAKEDYDFSSFWGDSSQCDSTTIIFERDVKMQKESFAIYGACMKNARTELSFKKINIVNDLAVVEIYEWLAYTRYSEKTGLKDFESGMGTPYTIRLQKYDNGWRINSIEFDSICMGVLQDFSISIEEYVRQVEQSASSLEQEPEMQTFNADETVGPNAVNNTFFDVNRFLWYANTYGGGARNSNFPSWSADCQNFASQCVWYALGGNNTASSIAAYDAPMIGPSVSNSDDTWWYCSFAGHSETWSYVSDFVDHLNDGDPGYGLVGTVRSGVEYAQVGDIIQISSNGSIWYHSYVVMAVTGIYGSRTPEDITVSSHTADLAWVSLADNNMDYYGRTVHIISAVNGYKESQFE